MKTKRTLKSLPYGSVVQYRNEVYWKSEGLETDILTNRDGHWFFVDELHWKSFQVLYSPPERFRRPLRAR